MKSRDARRFSTRLSRNDEIGTAFTILRHSSIEQSDTEERNGGVQVEVTTLDVSEIDETRQIIALAETLAPVGGVFHLAMALKDKWLANQARNTLSFFEKLPTISVRQFPAKELSYRQ